MIPTTLTACVSIPDLLLHLAMQQAAVRSPFAVVDDTTLARVRHCCRTAAAAGITLGMPAFLARQHCARLATITVPDSSSSAARATIGTLLAHQGDHVTEATSTVWYLRVLALGPRYAHAGAVAFDIQHTLANALGVAPIVVLAPTTTTARVVASAAAARDHTAPIVVLPGEEATVLAPLPVEHLLGVGASTHARLAHFGITTIGALAALPVATVTQIVGAHGRLLHARAHGADVGEGVSAVAHAPLEGTWQYRPSACADAATLTRHVHRLTERVGRHLRQASLTAGTITVTVRWADGQVRYRTERLPLPTQWDRELTTASHAAVRLLLAERRIAVRALTVRLGSVGPYQHTLLDGDPRLGDRQRALDAIRHRHGTDAIVWASLLLPAMP